MQGRDGVGFLFGLKLCRCTLTGYYPNLFASRRVAPVKFDILRSKSGYLDPFKSGQLNPF